MGDRLRELRKARRLTLQQVSAMTGLAPSTLSKVENRQMSLTYDNLLKLARGLGLDLADMLSPEVEGTAAGAGRRSVTRRGEGRVRESDSFTHYFLCADLARKRLVPAYSRVKARSLEAFGELVRHPGEEFVYVLEGEVEVHTEFYEPIRLAPGDSIYIDGNMGHAFLSAGDGEAVIIVVASAETLLDRPEQRVPPIVRRQAS